MAAANGSNGVHESGHLPSLLNAFRVAARDDGIGGADLRQGSGLLGLSDRIEALGGTLQLTSPVDNGTTLLIEVPLEDHSSAVSPEP